MYWHPPPRMWLWYVDDTVVIQKEGHKQNFLECINSIYLAIRFTVEDKKEDGANPFMDTIAKPEADGRLSITVYRKPTHTDQYLQWDSHQHLLAKYSVINSLAHRAKTVCNKPELLQKEMEHLRKALIHCKYPKWALDRVEKRLNKPTSEVSNVANNQGTAGALSTTNEVITKGHIVIPCTQGLCKSIEKICSRYGKQTQFKSNSTIKNLLVPPKNKDPMENKSGTNYCFQCRDLTCDEECIKQTSRTFGERFKEDLKEPSPINNLSNNTGHSTTQDNFQIIGREGHGIARTIKESIYIRVNNSTLNRNIGKFNLHNACNRVLLNTTGLQKGMHKILGMFNTPNLTPPCNFHSLYGACSEKTLV